VRAKGFLSSSTVLEEAYLKREPVQNPKLRYFKPFEFLTTRWIRAGGTTNDV
jgi:hypothetical protein